MPSSSARCAQFPRAQDKVHFYIKLRELRDQLKGVQKPAEIEEIKYSFDLTLAKGERGGNGRGRRLKGSRLAFNREEKRRENKLRLIVI